MRMEMDRLFEDALRSSYLMRGGSLPAPWRGEGGGERHHATHLPVPTGLASRPTRRTDPRTPARAASGGVGSEEMTQAGEGQAFVEQDPVPDTVRARRSRRRRCRG